MVEMIQTNNFNTELAPLPLGSLNGPSIAPEEADRPEVTHPSNERIVPPAEVSNFENGVARSIRRSSTEHRRQL